VKPADLKRLSPQSEMCEPCGECRRCQERHVWKDEARRLRAQQKRLAQAAIDFIEAAGATETPGLLERRLRTLAEKAGAQSSVAHRDGK